MIKPYIDISYNDDFGLMGLIFTCGYIPEEKAFQFCITLGGLTIALGVMKLVK